MPRYDYKCLECQNQFELSLSLAEKEAEFCEKKVCPKCNSTKIESLLAATPTVTASKGGALPPCAQGGGCPGSGSCGF